MSRNRATQPTPAARQPEPEARPKPARQTVAKPKPKAKSPAKTKPKAPPKAKAAAKPKAAPGPKPKPKAPAKPRAKAAAVAKPVPEPAREIPAPEPEPKKRRRVRVFVVAETIVITLGIAFLVLGRAGFVGSPISYVVVSGHSMEPTFHTGDVVVLRASGSYRKGEVIGYKVPAGGPGAGLIVIHRVIGGNAREGYLVRGDNKQFTDPWRPRPGDVVGHELLMVPKIGLAIRYIRSPMGFAALAALLTITIALGGGPPEKRPETEDPSDEGRPSPESGIADRRMRDFTARTVRRIVPPWGRSRRVPEDLSPPPSQAASSERSASRRRARSAQDPPETSAPTSSSASTATESPGSSSRSRSRPGESRSGSAAAGSPAARRASTPRAPSTGARSARKS